MRADDTPNLSWVRAGGADAYGRWAAFEVNGVRQRMRWLPPGTFLMGSLEDERRWYDDEGPQHEVTLSRDSWLGETPVTQALWVAVMGNNPSRFRGKRPEDLERPVEQVSWDDSQVFLERLNERVSGLFLRLPTEAEWERACRGGKIGATWGGEITWDEGCYETAPELDAIAWYAGNSGRQTHPVGRKVANSYGLYDMLGNVWEWCADDASRGLRTYSALPETDPVATGRGSHRVRRGGAWNSSVENVRETYRFPSPCSCRGVDLGFRLAGDQVSVLR